MNDRRDEARSQTDLIPQSTLERLDLAESLLDYEFSNRDLLRSALTHASGAAHRISSNERLEFLGDSILGMVVCEWLYELYPDYNEGDLTKIKSAVVSRQSCGRVGTELGLHRCLIVGRGVTRNQGFPRSLVSDVFEAIIAAIYLDSDFPTIRELVRGWLQEEISETMVIQGAGNAKSNLQQIAQREYAVAPQYRLLDEIGPDHRKFFQVAAAIGKQQYTPAWGKNKKDAEQRAAANALAEIEGEDPPFSDQNPRTKESNV